MKQKLIAILKQNKTFFARLINLFNYLNPRNKLLFTNAKLQLGLVRLSGVKIISNGTNNTITIEDFSKLKNCTIIINGSNNTISIGTHCGLTNVGLFMEDDHNSICIGQQTNIIGYVDFSAIEGTQITIGERCLFSNDLHFRTGDSHSILNMDGNRINPSADIHIGNHVWIGTKVTCLKGVQIADDCVVAATTTLCKQYQTPNCLIGGVPGKILKEGISWDKARL